MASSLGSDSTLGAMVRWVREGEVSWILRERGRQNRRDKWMRLGGSGGRKSTWRLRSISICSSRLLNDSIFEMVSKVLR